VNFQLVCHGISIIKNYYDNIEQAFFTYKAFKEKIIKQMANEYKGEIPFNLYNAMMSYVVEIED
jgi:hypothetical protein